MNSFDERLNQLNKEGFGDSIQEARLFSGRWQRYRTFDDLWSQANHLYCQSSHSSVKIDIRMDYSSQLAAWFILFDLILAWADFDIIWWLVWTLHENVKSSFDMEGILLL
jgi:hypothetical protein